MEISAGEVLFRPNPILRQFGVGNVEMLGRKGKHLLKQKKCSRCSESLPLKAAKCKHCEAVQLDKDGRPLQRSSNCSIYGLSRNIPSDVRKEVRRRSGYGCIFDGFMFCEYDHFEPEFTEIKEHSAECIALLCTQCHDKKRGRRPQITNEMVKARYASPFYNSRGQVSYPNLFVTPGPQLIGLGEEGFTATAKEAFFLIDNTPFLSLQKQETEFGPIRFSGEFHDYSGETIVSFQDNVLTAHPKEGFDFEFEAAQMIFRMNREPFLVIDRSDNSFLKIVKANFWFKGHHIEVLAKGLYINEKVKLEGPTFMTAGEALTVHCDDENNENSWCQAIFDFIRFGVEREKLSELSDSPQEQLLRIKGKGPPVPMTHRLLPEMLMSVFEELSKALTISVPDHSYLNRLEAESSRELANRVYNLISSSLKTNEPVILHIMAQSPMWQEDKIVWRILDARFITCTNISKQSPDGNFTVEFVNSDPEKESTLHVYVDHQPFNAFLKDDEPYVTGDATKRPFLSVHSSDLRLSIDTVDWFFRPVVYLHHAFFRRTNDTAVNVN